MKFLNKNHERAQPHVECRKNDSNGILWLALWLPKLCGERVEAEVVQSAIIAMQNFDSSNIK